MTDHFGLKRRAQSRIFADQPVKRNSAGTTNPHIRLITHSVLVV